MKPHLRCLSLLALAALGCSSILGLDDFKDAPASGGSSGVAGAGGNLGGASGAGGSTPSGGAAGTAGSGGSNPDGGDGGPNIVCTETSVMDVFTPSDFGAGSIVDAKSLRILRSLDSANTVFIVIGYEKQDKSHWLAIRSYKDGDSQPGSANFSPYADMFSTRSGYGQGPTLKIYGVSQSNIVRSDYKLDGGTNINSSPPAPLVPLPTPPECKTGYEHGSVFVDDPTKEEYGVSCDSGGKRFAYLVAGTPHLLSSGAVSNNDDSGYRVKGVTHVGAKFMVALDDGNIYQGPNPAALTHVVLDLKKGGTDINSMLAVVPLPADQGSLVMPARLNLSPISGTLYSASFALADYGMVGDKSKYTAIVELADVTQIPRFEHVNFGQNAVLAAGVAADGQHVLFYKFTRDGKPLVSGFALSKPQNLDDTMNAEAAALGLINDVVVWTETGPVLKVRAARLLCAPK